MATHGRNEMAGISRREILKAIGTGMTVASGAPYLARSARAATPWTLKILLWSHFVPAFDKWIAKFAEEWGKKERGQIVIDHIPHLEIPARLGAELAAQAGHDIVMMPARGGVHLYAKHVVDLTDLVEEAGKPYGGWSAFAYNISNVGGRWLSYPDYGLAMPGLYRKDLFDAEGLKAPVTWEDVRTAGRTLRPKGHPVGIAISHTPDANTTWGGILWCYGASWVDKDAKTIIINSKETREALRLGKALFDEAMTSEVFAWDDASNNRFLAAGKGCYIHNAISALRSIEKTNPALAEKIDIAPTPKGPGGQFYWAPGHHYAIWKFSRNVDVAKAFLRAYHEGWRDAVRASEGYNQKLFKNIPRPYPVLDEDVPKYKVVVEETKYFATAGHPGVNTAPAVEVGEQYIIPDMVAKVCKGMSIDEAISWAEGEIRKIYKKWEL